MRTSGVTVVVITRDRAARLRYCLARLAALPEQPRIIVVDNGSADDTGEVLAQAGPRVRGIVLARNAGAAGRNVGVAHAETPYVAFSDDDSWWAPGSLRRAESHFERCARLGLVAARILVGEGQRLDSNCLAMQHSPLAVQQDLPGPAILGFLACGAVVRREAFLQAGGFHSRYEVGGEERLLAIDLSRRGWGLAYCDDLTAHHHPEAVERPQRRSRMVRNDLWTIWLRYAPLAALAGTARAFLDAARDAGAREGLLRALRGLPWVLRERSAVDVNLSRSLALLRSVPASRAR